MRVGLPDDGFPQGPSMSLPSWYRPSMCDQTDPLDSCFPEPSIPKEESKLPSPFECEGKRVNRTLEQNTVLIDTAARWMKEAQDYKALWMAEVLRGDHDQLEHYAVQELDKARAEAGFWHKDKDATGAILMGRQS